jgi:hypothetical protein
MTAIVAGEMVFRFSTTAGAAGDATANTTVGTFLGKYAATSAWAGGGVNDVFPDITGAENAASQIDYACLFYLNNNTSNNAVNCSLYLSSEVAGGASISIASDNIAASAKGSSSAQAAQIASRTTAPSGVSAFSSPTTAAGGISLGTVNVAQVKGWWMKRTAANTSAVSADGVTIGLSVDTGNL